MGVTGPMNIKKPGPLFRKIVLRHFAAPNCHPSTFIDLSKIVLAKKKLLEDHMHGFRERQYPYWCHWPDEIQKITTSFSENRDPDFCGTCFPSKHFYLLGRF